MSSSNQVRVAFIEESVLGETPVAGDFSSARFISESLSGTPETTESAQIRTDRLASGQIVTGLTVGGELSFELAKEAALEEFMESAMLNTWVEDTPITVDITIDNTAKTLTRASGDWAVDAEVVDVITLVGFGTSTNNTQIIVAEVTSALVLTYTGELTDEVGSGTSFEVADKLEIGTTKKSFSVEKAFLDLTDKAINYTGMLCNTMALNVAYGEIINGSFGFVGTSYEAVEASGDFITDGRTITAAATTQSLNGSIDMPLIVSDITGSVDGLSFCIQSVEISMDNNGIAQNCIGRAAPQDYSMNTAAISISLSAYLADDNWDILARKLTQESFSLGFIVRNDDGGYGFYLPAVQVSFEDPSSGGANQDIILEMSGTAKVGANGEKSLYIYRF